jgi:hypothetical protein
LNCQNFPFQIVKIFLSKLSNSGLVCHGSKSFGQN